MEQPESFFRKVLGHTGQLEDTIVDIAVSRLDTGMLVEPGPLFQEIAPLVVELVAIPSWLILAAIRVFPDEAALIEMRVYEPRGRPDDGIRSGHRPGEPFGVGRCAVAMIFKAAAARENLVHKFSCCPNLVGFDEAAGYCYQIPPR